MNHAERESRSAVTDLLFRIGMYWRIVYGAISFSFGIFLLRLVGTPLSQVLYRALGSELAEDPRDFLVSIGLGAVTHLSFSVTYFIAIYFIFWGFIDVALSIALLRHKLWAFVPSMYLIALFVVYEMYRYTHTHSSILLFIIFIDIILILLIRNEYKNLKSGRIH
jgi:uncharacterized membrane protein